MTDEASHLPLEPDPAMVGGGGGGEEDERFLSGAESLGDWKADAGRRRGRKGGIYCPLIGGKNVNRPSTYALKLACSQCKHVP